MSPQSREQSTSSILIVDDTPQNLQLLFRLLRDRGYNARPVSSGALALEAARQMPPDLILLDINMPDMDGYQVCERLKADPNLKDIPVIFISALNESLDKVKAFGFGGVDYIAKPFQAEEVEARVKTHLTLYHQQRAERDLLENTLNGSIKLLSDIIAATDPASFGRARKLRDLMRTVSTSIKTESNWEYELAAMLAGIGLVTIPPSVISRSQEGQHLSSKEIGVLDRIPQIGHDLLSNIPRLERVARIILYQNKNYDGSGFPVDLVSGEEIPHGARLLHILTDLLKQEEREPSRTAVLAGMRHTSGRYDINLLEGVIARFSSSRQQTFPSHEEQAPRDELAVADGSRITKTLDALSEDKYLMLAEIRAGQILKSDVMAANGVLIVGAETVMSAMLLMKLHNFAELTGIVEPIKVRLS